MNKEKAEYIQNWLFRANEDIAVIHNLVKSGVEHYTSTICFHAQQAAEKYLKAYLVFHNVDFPKTHDLDFLLSECQKIDKTVFGIDLKSLTDFGVAVIYPDDFYIPDVKETLEYCDIVFEIEEIVERLIVKN